MSIRRVAAAALCAVAAGGSLAACGGGGSDKKDYQAKLNTFCKAVEDGANKVQTDASSVQTTAGSDPTAAIKKIGGVLGTFATSIDNALKPLKSASVPSDYKDFNTKAVSGISDLASKVHQAADAATKGDAAAVTALGTTINAIKLPNLPGDIAKNAPSCSRISTK